MKLITTLLACLVLTVGTSAQQDVTLTMTYNGQPICKYEVTIKVGDVAIGSGTTDNAGVVVFPGVVLITPAVDVYAHKSGALDKHFEVQGWVMIQEDYTYELKMEEILHEIADGSGMPPSIFADSWGLNALDCQ
jgi:hypothetical protein